MSTALFGRVALTLALVAACWVVAAAVAGARGRGTMLDSARSATYGVFIAVVVTVATMVAALLANQFRIHYVAENSSSATSAFYRVIALWAGDAGSLLLWNLCLAGYLALFARRHRLHREIAHAWALAVIGVVQVFYLTLTLVIDPFATTESMTDGRGPQPLLESSFLMAYHPPLLYLGFVGFTVPFALAMGTLIARDHNLLVRWTPMLRRWSLIAWCFLTIGLVLGALWAYEVLGWGGYWAWDPVENAAFMPWLTATAYLHSTRLRERGGPLGRWNLYLLVVTLSLITLGTFLTRGSLLTSVHAFAESPVSGMYLAFLLVILGGGIWLVRTRAGMAINNFRMRSLLCRETAIMANNLVLIVLCVTVLSGTLYPLVVEALSGPRVSVGRAYYEEMAGPLLILLVLLAGAGQLLAWQVWSPQRVMARAVPAGLGSAGVAAAVMAAGVRSTAVVAVLAVATFTLLVNTIETWSIWRAGGKRYSACGAFLGHAGLAIAAAGIATSMGLAGQAEITLSPGEQSNFRGEIVHYQGVRTQTRPEHTDLITKLTVGKVDLSPSLRLVQRSADPVGMPAIRHDLTGDLYVSVLAIEQPGGRANFHFYSNPGIGLLWVGGACAAAGGLVSVCRRRRVRGKHIAEASGRFCSATMKREPV